MAFLCFFQGEGCIKCRTVIHYYYNLICIVVQGVILLSDTPQSKNVSAGTLVKFTCATPETGLLSFTMSTSVTLGVNSAKNDMILQNGDRQLTLNFIAPSKHQSISVACIASRINTMGMVDVNTSTALLMIQGKTALTLCPHYNIR